MGSADATAATSMLQAFLASLDVEVAAPRENSWHVPLSAAGLDLDLRLSVGATLLRAEAPVLPGGLLDPHRLLAWNRQAPLIAFGEDADGAVWVAGELPLAGLETETLDRFLGLLVSAATRAREVALAGTAP